MFGKRSMMKRAGLVRDVEQHIIRAALFHLAVDGARHDVARRERFQRMIFVHELTPVVVLSTPPSPRTASLMRNDFALG